MSGQTPNLGLKYLDPSQSQPEVKVNDAWDKLDAAGGSISVSDLSSPPIVGLAKHIKFSGGVSVTHETGGIALVHIDASSGGGPDSDTGGGGGGGSATFLNANVTVDSHPEAPTARDDEFEGTTLNARWTWLNENTAAATFANGALNLTSSVAAALDINAITQPLVGALTAFEYRAKLSQQITANYHQGGFVLVESGTGKLLRFVLFYSGGVLNYSADHCLNPTTYGANIANGTFALPLVFSSTVPWYYSRLQLLAGNYVWSISATGEEGTFLPLASVAQAAWFTTAADTIGLMAASQNASTASALFVDWFRDYTAGYTPSIGDAASTVPHFLEPEQHTGTPTFAANDEFEQAAGTAIDTVGTRFSGAAPWIWGNQGTSSALQTGDGNLNLLGQADGNYHGIYQAIAHAAPWKYRARVSLQNAAASAGDLASIFALNSANGHIIGFGPFANTPGMVLIKWTNWTTFSTTAFNALPRNFTSQALVTPTWYELRSDGTTLTFAVSASGAEGSFIDVTTETIATFIGAVTHVGLSISTNSAPPSSLITDLFRQYL